MPATKMKVTLVEHTPDPESLVAAAGRSCYGRKSTAELKGSLSADDKKRLLKLLLSGGHHSPIEHASFTFGIEGISRSCSHQLVRHRLASYSQQSQRYVGADNLSFIVPPAIEGDDELERFFVGEMDKIGESYEKLAAALEEKGRTPEQAKEDARFLLPNAAETKIAMTMNARELVQAANLRMCLRAQWEIRRLFSAMKKEVKEVAPTFARYMVPKCDPLILGYCPEGKLACHWVDEGRVKLKSDVVGA
ncbi:MAG: FAD-dependent thymidylate synthase [Terriglobia bacterium]